MNREVIACLFKFTDSGSGAYLVDSHKRYVDEVIDKILIEVRLYTAELEAKVYTYEKIIANSNFKSILSKDEQELEGNND